MTHLEEAIRNIDWEQLRKQKLLLTTLTPDHRAEGLLSLIDHIQDAVVADGMFTEEQVFPEREYYLVVERCEPGVVFQCNTFYVTRVDDQGEVVDHPTGITHFTFSAAMKELRALEANRK